MIHAETIRILATRFTIRSNWRELIERLSYLTQRAEQEVALEAECAITVMWNADQYRISGGHGEDACATSLEMTFEALFARLHDTALRAYSDHIRIHAASGFGPDGMVLLVGQKWAGKTTTAMHLLLEGFEITGDELVLLRHGRAVTFPRPFYLRHTALPLLPKLAGVTEGAPFVNADADGRLVAVDPLKLGRSWRIREAPIAAVIVLEPNHGGTSRMEVCGKLDMTRRVMTQCTAPLSGRADWIADFCASINHAETFVAAMGDLVSATPLFRRFFAP